MNSEAPKNYITILKIYGKVYYAIWQDEENAKNSLVTLPASSRFLLCDTLNALRESAAKRGLTLEDEEPSFQDMDRFFRTLARWRPLRISSTRTCRILSDGLNMLEDMARSVGVPVLLNGKDEEAPLWKAYEKLFCGSNLPAMTPKGECYHPWFPCYQRKAIRRYLRKLWRETAARSGQFNVRA